MSLLPPAVSPASRDASSQISVLLLMTLGMFAAFFYARMLIGGSVAGHPVAFAMLVVAEGIGMIQATGVWLTSLFRPFARAADPEDVPRIRELLRKAPSHRVPPDLVAVFVPVCGEPISVIRSTLTAARDMRVPHRTIVLDDGASEHVRALASELGITYMRRPERVHAKAGNLNFGISRVQSQFFAIFDSDHRPHPAFLEETLPHLLADPLVGFVQTPQHFRNVEGFVPGGSAEMQEAFYAHVMPGKNLFGAAFCVGTNVVFRTAAIREVGGIYEESNSEDIWTSLLLHERGWKSVYVPLVLAEGLAPETLGDHFRQQFRWARGGMEIFFGANPLFRRLSVDQKVQYLHATSHYFSGVAVLLYMLLPLMLAYAGWQPIRTDGGGEFLLNFLPYYAVLTLTGWHLSGRRWPWRAMVMGVSGFAAQIAAILSVLLGQNLRWSVTGVIKRRTDYITAVAPHLLLLAFSVGALPIVLLKTEHAFGLRLVLAFWICLNIAMLASVCRRAFPESDEIPAFQTVPAAA